MSKINNPKLYEKVKKELYSEMPKHSAYRSGLLVKLYKKRGGTYSGEKPKKGLTRWFKEDWRTEKGNKTYKEGGTIFRPTKRITKDTPKTMNELTQKEKQKAIKEKKSKGRVKKY
tara:strand:- start:25251 stop:25595 length:345 start_codon:yes stop_codon:yes gene_type:complete